MQKIKISGNEIRLLLKGAALSYNIDRSER